MNVHKIDVGLIWNTGFRRVLTAVIPHQIYCQSLPLSDLLRERRLLFHGRLYYLVYSQSWFTRVRFDLLRITAKYELDDRNCQECRVALNNIRL